MDAMDYKTYHEQFMRNNHGSTAWHTFFCIFFTIQCSLYCSIGRGKPSLKQCALEYFSIIIPLVIVHTIITNHILTVNCIAFAILMVKFGNYYKHNIVEVFSEPNKFQSERIKSVSIIRALTYVITVFCILGVDFKCFPRFLAKTEQYGFSLMDTGVGLFVLMSGIVHKDLKRDNFNKITKVTAILFLLGVARFWSVKQLDYQENVTEYGVHWNFFFTLAVCKLISTALLVFSNNAILLSVLTLVLHEFLLYNSLQDWVFSDDPRLTLLSANREGICSSLGYVSLYLCAVHIKAVLNDKSVKRFELLHYMFSRSIFLWLLLFTVHILRPTSRTLANAGYCLYMEATLLSVLTIMYIFEVLFEKVFDVPLILIAVNKNGLLYFLIANLMTGFVNLTTKTLLVSTSFAMTVLNIYMLFTLGLTMFLLKVGIKL